MWFKKHLHIQTDNSLPYPGEHIQTDSSLPYPGEQSQTMKYMIFNALSWVNLVSSSWYYSIIQNTKYIPTKYNILVFYISVGKKNRVLILVTLQRT